MGVHQNIRTSVLKNRDKANFPPKQVVHCCYTGYSLQDETIFDIRVSKGNRGWDKTLLKTNKQGKALLESEPEQARGKKGQCNAKILPNAKFFFEMELLHRLNQAHLNGSGGSWAAVYPQYSEQSWKNTRTEMSQKLSKCVKHQMVVWGKKKA
ncbi:hypothetical protein HPG69_008942 [Diceros bicornis minor]|uniref:peptidylprolyl isomerase n=1 Tax=Diceros bicornis minor TaxID=77932 RepID=A0A7J7EBE5_DICBM|nr:hypothetical protein HPG69_008942 [Diceros bicornis minor]